MGKIYDVDYFIKKFEAIPEDKWLVRQRCDGKGNHCAHGWCDIRNFGRSKEEDALIEVFKPIKNGHGCAGINNGIDPKYQQPTPKQRILAALYDIKKMQSKEPEVKECDATKNNQGTEVGKPKEIIRYVSVSESLTEQTKELILQ